MSELEQEFAEIREYISEEMFKDNVPGEAQWQELFERICYSMQAASFNQELLNQTFKFCEKLKNS